MPDNPTDRFARFLDRSLHVIADEAPAHFAALRARLRGIAIRANLGGSSPVRVQLDVMPWLGGPAHAEVVALTDQSTILEVLAGGLTLDEAVEADRLLLHGELDHLLRFFHGFEAWVHGAVRCPSMPVVLAEYRREAIPTSTHPQMSHVANGRFAEGEQP